MSFDKRNQKESLIKEIEASKMEVVTLTDEERAAFRDFNEGNREEFRDTIGDKGMDILYKMQEEKAVLENE